VRLSLRCSTEEGGGVINNASINAIRGNYGLVAYSASKGGVASMTRPIALDYATRNICVNSFCPATIDTRMLQEYLTTCADPDATRAAMVAKHPIGWIADAEEVASVAVFLASSDASFITGQSIPVDGGRSIW
jgi:NAD(P)-dependent dehydrogenase (short-subunit alcohol dehydrogenase family)